MKGLFITYVQALGLKELGFNEPCFTYWVHDGVDITFATSHNKSGWSMIGFKNTQMDKKAGLCTAPTYEQVFDWFRINHGLHIAIGKSINPKMWSGVIKLNDSDVISMFTDDKPTYDEIKVICVNALINSTKEKTK